MIPSSDDYTALGEGIRQFLDATGAPDLPPNLAHIGFDRHEQLGAGVLGVCARGPDGQITILIRAGRPAEHIKRTTLHELKHASDLLNWPWLLHADAERLAESFVRRHT